MKPIKTSAPGKLLLLGDHAVVYGRPCLVMAIDKKVTVVTTAKGGKESVFVAAARRLFEQKYGPVKAGFKIQSFDRRLGWGSSAAVTVAVVKAMFKLKKIKVTKRQLFDFCYRVVKRVQGVGSGFDIAAAIYGGVVYFVTGGKKIEKLAVKKLPLVVGYSGTKADTVTMIKKAAPRITREFLEQSTRIVEKGRRAIEQKNWPKLGRLMNQNQELLCGLGVSTPWLEKMTRAALKAGAWGAKLSGAGGGDCMIALFPAKKATAFAPVNVALIKYWGKADEKLKLPANASLSVNLTNLGTVTTVKWDKSLPPKITSKNNFPLGTGLSSSASGYAAMTVAMAAAAGLKLSEKELSRLARLGSGSACRSIPDGWVEWRPGTDKTSYGKTIFPANWWDLRILVVILSTKPKTVSSTAGQALAATSPYFAARIKSIPEKIKQIKVAIKQKDFSQLGQIMEADCLNMHHVMQTQKPALNYLLPETKTIMKLVRQWRREGLESYFTVNTGQNVFVFCEPKNEIVLAEKLSHLRGVIEVKRDRIGLGARLLA